MNKREKIIVFESVVILICDLILLFTMCWHLAKGYYDKAAVSGILFFGILTIVRFDYFDIRLDRLFDEIDRVGEADDES